MTHHGVHILSAWDLFLSLLATVLLAICIFVFTRNVFRRLLGFCEQKNSKVNSDSRTALGNPCHQSKYTENKTHTPDDSQTVRKRLLSSLNTETEVERLRTSSVERQLRTDLTEDFSETKDDAETQDEKADDLRDVNRTLGKPCIPQSEELSSEERIEEEKIKHEQLANILQLMQSVPDRLGDRDWSLENVEQQMKTFYG